MISDNQLKSINGAIGRDHLLSVLSRFQRKGLISYCNQKFRCGYPSMDTEQFYAPFYLEFTDRTAWILYSTNSIRSDRICIQQWNAENIKKIRPEVRKSIVVIPDSVKENKREMECAERYKEQIASGKYYTALDDIVFLSELESVIASYNNN